MNSALVAAVAGGYRVGGVLCHMVQLRELTGNDHVFLVDEVGTLSPASWTTEALRRCISSLPNGDPMTTEQVRSLTVGDREALLLQLRQISLGDDLHCVLNCPSDDCKETLDLRLSTAELLLPVSARQTDVHETELKSGDASCRVRFHLATGEDQQSVVELARSDPWAAADALRKRCVEAAATDSSAVDELPSEMSRQLEDLMCELDPQAEVRLSVTCVLCGRAFDAIFDVASYFFQELQAGMRHLLHEVHLLAYHYHWSLAEILGMSIRARRRFLRLLDAELAGAGR